MNANLIDTSKMSDRHEVAVVSDASALIQVIERAARDPSIDIDKMERLMQMHERLMANRAKVAYAAALARLQPQLPMLDERGEIKNNAGNVQSRYALWEDIVTAITPILAGEGFSLSFRTGNPEGKIRVTGILTHAEGHSEETTLDLPADTSGAKNAVQAVASSVSYGKRYTAGALLNLRSGEPDHDGREPEPRVSEHQTAELKALITEHGGNMGKLLAYFKVRSLDEILAKNYDYAVAEVKRLAAAREAAKAGKS